MENNINLENTIKITGRVCFVGKRNIRNWSLITGRRGGGLQTGGGGACKV